MQQKGGKAKGMDGWAGYELRLLPIAFWERIASFFDALEEHPNPRWPTSLTTASIAMIPKGEGPDPIKQRPVTVFSYLYREYAGLRYEDTQRWQDSWAPTEMYGATPKRDATDASWMMALEMEEATAMGEELYAVLLDNSKYFGFFKRHIYIYIYCGLC